MLASALLASGSTPASAHRSQSGDQDPISEAASMWLTTPDGSRLLTREPDLAVVDTPADLPEIVVDARDRHQAMLGFGASMTDSSAALIMRLPRRRAIR
jgi:glucosylceramidase